MRAALSFRRLVRRSTGLFIGVVLVTAPAVVLASHNFSDVPNGHENVNTVAPADDEYFVRVFLVSDAGDPGNAYTVHVAAP